MKHVRVYLSAAILSVEFFWIVIGAFLVQLAPQLDIIATFVPLVPEAYKYLALLPTFVIVKVRSDNWKLLFPGDGQDKTLHEWPDYWKLRIYINVNFVYAFIFTGLGVISWALGWPENEARRFVLVMVVIIGILIVYASTYFALIDQKEILIQDDK